jgi:hypothetical protein
MHLNSTINSKENFNQTNLPDFHAETEQETTMQADDSEAASNSQQIQMRLL